MPIPAELAAAVTHPDGGRVVLIIGAGCSKEAPTNLGLASEYAEKAYQDLLGDGTLLPGSCANTSDLSTVADAVWAARGSQQDLIDCLPRDAFARAEPNEGHLLAAAMLSEHALIGVLTLNFDLAMSHALQQLDVTGVAVVAGPDDYASLGVINLVYLHRNVNSAPEDWVLRTIVMVQGWQNSWQEAVAQRFLNTPVRVFAGLGTPAGVLIETTRRIRQMVPAAGALVYQVDVIPRQDSAFATALETADEAFVQMGWSDFMRSLGDSLVSVQAARLALRCEERLLDNQWPAEDVGSLRGRIEGLGLIGLGKMRARWMLDQRVYLPAKEVDHLQLADLLLGIGFIERHMGAVGRFTADGVVEFKQHERLLCSVVFASGRGAKPWVRLDAELRQQENFWRYRNPRPRHAVVTGVWGLPAAGISAPANLAIEADPESILLGDAPFELQMFSVDQLRADPVRVTEIIV